MGECWCDLEVVLTRPRHLTMINKMYKKCITKSKKKTKAMLPYLQGSLWIVLQVGEYIKAIRSCLGGEKAQW